MNPREVDALSDEEYAAMVRYANAEIEEVNRAAGETLMAGSAILKIDVLADASKAVKGLNDVGTPPKNRPRRCQTFGTKAKTAFTGVTTSVAGMASGGLGAATAIAGLGSALVDASKAAMEDEKSQALLRNGDGEHPRRHRQADRLDGGLRSTRRRGRRG